MSLQLGVYGCSVRNVQSQLKSYSVPMREPLYHVRGLINGIFQGYFLRVQELCQDRCRPGWTSPVYGSNNPESISLINQVLAIALFNAR